MPPPASSDTIKPSRHHTWSTTSVKSGSTSGRHDHHRHQQHDHQQQQYGQPRTAARKEADAATVQRWLDRREPTQEDVLDRVARAFGPVNDRRGREAKMKMKMKL
ncbi:uncharacterized protein Z520_10680 [Fonsecaea multimorphosa CBS 102226]|uniref:Uncharacterized protein n=1 Tax=Fonsecaea multimorphosa CBS 102226 TaxID=1442371 RepID=A0A0D2JJW4_9EURO|nr:uncharacterized protein Z520_10680 [Fonsecaea multimorphosa CBS 102226]KIX93502.1 hypothetical protein Z520_10680 [Fonsecaea multimorphosa CBS 102226]OAL18818.1 hypothetical protein AYO22_10147 [Fonsecaea multimorphosa]